MKLAIAVLASVLARLLSSHQGLFLASAENVMSSSEVEGRDQMAEGGGVGSQENVAWKGAIEPPSNGEANIVSVSHRLVVVTSLRKTCENTHSLFCQTLLPSFCST